MKDYKKYKDILGFEVKGKVEKEIMEIIIKGLDKINFDYNKFNLKNIDKLEKDIWNIIDKERKYSYENDRKRYDKIHNFIWKSLFTRKNKAIFFLKLSKLDKKWQDIFKEDFFQKVEIFEQWYSLEIFIDNIKNKKMDTSRLIEYYKDNLKMVSVISSFNEKWRKVKSEDKKHSDLRVEIIKKILKNLRKIKN